MSNQPLQDHSDSESEVQGSLHASSSLHSNGKTPWREKFAYLNSSFARLCSPAPWLGKLLSFSACVVLLYVLLLVLFKSGAGPGSSLFTFFSLWLSCIVTGYLLALTKVIPPLFGMIAVGVLFANVPILSDYADDLSRTWTANFRVGAFCLVLMQAGLGIDVHALKRLKGVCFRLAFTPCCCEAVTVGIVAHFLMGLPFAYSFLLGFGLGAVTPAVLVPLMLSLKSAGLGVAKGLPTLLIAASSIDDILAITVFSLLVGATARTGYPGELSGKGVLNETISLANKTETGLNVAWTVLQGPMVVVLGVAYGCIVGVLLWRFPPKDMNLAVLYRTVLMCLACGVGMFGSMALKMGGAGPLAALSAAFVASVGWRDWEDADKVWKALDVMWFIGQPFLFGLIGLEVRLRDLDPGHIGFGICVLLIGLVARIACSYFTTACAGFNKKERIFIALAWLPKATVQAALAPVVLDTITKQVHMIPAVRAFHLVMAKRVMNVLILSIVTTAPLGAVIISATGRFLLAKEGPSMLPLSEQHSKDG